MENWLKDAGEIIVTILKEGGSRALWGLGMYLIYELLRIVFIGGAIWALFSAIFSGINSLQSNWLKLKEPTRNKQISLLSSKVSGQVKDLVSRSTAASSGLQENWNTTLKRIEEKLVKLEKNSSISQSDSPTEKK